MTQAKHTPSPWLYENGKGIIACGNPLKVAGRTKVAIANRALISQAPNLYHLLSEMRKWMGEEVSGWDAKFIDEIDATLAKARGES